MKIRVIWNRPDGTNHEVDMPVNANDPHQDDHELQLSKALAAAGVYFNNKFGEHPKTGQMNASLVLD